MYFYKAGWLFADTPEFRDNTKNRDNSKTDVTDELAQEGEKSTVRGQKRLGPNMFCCRHLWHKLPNVELLSSPAH